MVNLIAVLVSLAGCASDHHGASGGAVTATINKSEQQAMTPDQALARLVEGNRRFAAGESQHHDYIAQAKATASGQYPFAVVLACIDSRTAPEIVFDQGIGDLFVPRVAGNGAFVDMLGSMEYSTKVAGAKLVIVMGHTECGAVKGACDDVRMGNLTAVIEEIRPSVNDVQGVSGEHNSHNKAFVRAATEMHVRRTVEKIRHDSPIMRELEVSGQIKIVGAMHDISTGQVTFVN